MGKTTGIEWAEATWNPWYGCTKVSAGCKNCYAERDMIRFGLDFYNVNRSKTTFKNPLKWKEPKLIFVCSWGDFFHEDVPTIWLDDAWDIMTQADHHIYLLLTKRPQNIMNALPTIWSIDGIPEHIWFGVTVEWREEMWRLVALEKVPATTKFVSVEPILGALPLLHSFFPSLHWVITGGESGSDCRPANLDWFRDIRDQCVDYNIPYFHKQHGGKRKVNGSWGGRELDGKIWDEMPAYSGIMRELENQR